MSSISASSTRLVLPASGTGAARASAGGSAAERAYTAALKDLREAQQQLAKDVAANAGEDKLKADQLAVQLAQATLAQAAADVADEKRAAQEQKTEQKTDQTETRAPTSYAVVDTYA